MRSPSPDLFPFRGHLPVLDGIRGLAVLLVVAHHGFGLRLGWIGVELFFVLSGFLITGVLLDAKGQGARTFFGNFFARRSLRIVPLYYLVVTITILVLPAIDPDRFRLFTNLKPHALWFFTYTQNLLFASVGTILKGGFHLWSLAIEEQFYLSYPILVFWLTPRRLLQASLLLAAGSIAFRNRMVTQYPDYYVLPTTRLDSLLIGACTAIAVRHHQAWLARTVPAMTAVAWVALVILAVRTWPYHDWTNTLLIRAGYTVFALAAAGLILAALREGRWRRFFGHPWLTVAGKYSYGLYVYHYLIHSFLRPTWEDAFGPHLPPPIAKLAGSILSLSITVGVTFVSYHLVEAPFLRLKPLFLSVSPPTHLSRSPLPSSHP